MTFLYYLPAVLLIILFQWLGTKNILSSLISREIQRMIYIISSALLLISCEQNSLIIGVSLLLFLMLLNKKLKLFFTIKDSSQNNYSLTFFLMGYLFLLVVVPHEFIWVVFLTYVSVGIAEPIGGIISSSIDSKSFSLTSGRKTYLGSAIFFLLINFVLLISAADFFKTLFPLFPGGYVINIYLFLSAIAVSLMLTMIESITSRGFDKLLLPIIASILIYVFWTSPKADILPIFLTGIFFAGLIAGLSYYAKFLTANGAVATFILAGFLFGFGGFKWSIPILAFFILSSLLSKARKKVNYDVELFFEKSGVRDYWQVAANGGIGGVLILINLFYPSDFIYLMYIASLAAVCADTWATEIGTFTKTSTYNILNFKPVEQGLSGGISLIGTLGAICGAFVISLSGFFWVEINLLYYFLIIILAGTVGSFFDSILGATIQAQNKCNVCDKITEREIHCGEVTYHFRGYRWLNNDIVNLFAGIAGVIVILIFIGII